MKGNSDHPPSLNDSEAKTPPASPDRKNKYDCDKSPLPDFHYDIPEPASLESSQENCPEDPDSLFNEDDLELVECGVVEFEDLMDIDIGRGKPFPMHMFDGMDPTPVDTIPDDLNGLQYLSIKTSQETWHQDTSDRYFWRNMSTSRANFHGVRKIGRCMGSPHCPNPNCAFLKTSRFKEPNKVNWKLHPTRRRVKVCKVCGTFAEYQTCGAYKVVEFDPRKNVALVYHLGSHQCSKKPETSSKMAYLSKVIETKSCKGGIKQMAVAEIEKCVPDMEKASDEASKWTNRGLAKKVQEKQIDEALPDGHSFDAVSILKQKADQTDPYYIFKMHNGQHDNTRDFVFKSSREMCRIMVLMDIEGEENPFQDEIAFFDTCHSRVSGFKCMGLWTYHPAMGKIIRLANMEMRSECTEDITKFFNLVNEMLEDYTKKKGYKFNPKAFFSDAAGSNHAALTQVYGQKLMEEDRIVGCLWHFKNDKNRKKNMIAPELRDQFEAMCKKLVEAQNCSAFNLQQRKLANLARRYPDQLQSWVNWWTARKHTIFPAFRGSAFPGVNYSEQGNAGWVCCGRNLRLVHAARQDLATMSLQEQELLAYEGNEAPSAGTGPSQSARDARSREEQVSFAKDFAELIGDPEALAEEARQMLSPEHFVPGKNARHRPPRSQEYNVQGQAVKSRGRGKARGGIRGRGSSARQETERTSIGSVDLDAQRVTRGASRGRPRGRARGTGRGRGRGRRTEDLPNNTALVRQARAKILQCEELIGRQVLADPNRRMSKVDQNPPILVSKPPNSVSRCQGCNRKVTALQIENNVDMVFQRKGLRGFFSSKQERYVEYPGKLYFHLKLACLKEQDRTVGLQHLVCPLETFLALTVDQIQHLHDMGYLPAIVINLKEVNTDMVQILAVWCLAHVCGT